MFCAEPLLSNQAMTLAPSATEQQSVDHARRLSGQQPEYCAAAYSSSSAQHTTAAALQDGPPPTTTTAAPSCNTSSSSPAQLHHRNCRAVALPAALVPERLEQQQVQQDSEQAATVSTHLLLQCTKPQLSPDHAVQQFPASRQCSSPDGISCSGYRAESWNSSSARGSNSISCFEGCSGSPRCPERAAQQQHSYVDWQQQQQQHDAPCPVLRAAEQAVSARLLPPLLLLVMVSYIDRTNLSFAR